MLINYLKVAFRNLIRQKVYSVINILGLAIGLGVCLLILLFVKDELSYDKYHANADRIYRVITQWDLSNKKTQSPMNSYRLAPALKTDFPEFEEVVRLSPTGGIIAYEEEEYQEDEMYFADENIFELFDFELLIGQTDRVLKEPNTVVLSESTAKKYFGKADPIGKVLNFNNEFDATVTGIFRDFKPNNHFISDAFISMETGKQVFNQLVLNNWGEISQYTYLMLPEQMEPERINARFPDFLEKNLGEGASEQVGMFLQPMLDIHLKSSMRGEMGQNGNIRYIYISSAIALFIILIACINYMNLATARSVKRAMEIGVRKTLGAGRFSLIKQFLAESTLLAMLAFFLSLGLVQLSLPAFNAFVEKSLTINPLVNADALLLFFALALVIGLLAGSYPAFYLSSFQAVRVFRERSLKDSASGLLRKFLVVFQFGISIVLIIGTLIIYQQWNFLRNKDLGYDKENLLFVPIPSLSQYETLKLQLQQNPNILSVTASNKRLTNALSSNLGFEAENFEQDPKNPTSIKIVTIDHDFMKTLETKLVAGRDFSKEYGSDDTEAFILNEAAVEMIGWDDPVGKWFKTSEFNDGAWAERSGKIIGVVSDFNMESLHNDIRPVVYYVSKTWLNWMTIRLNSTNTPQTIDYIKDKWVQYGSEQAFDYTFMDERIDELYRSEARYFSLFTIFTLIAIFIGSLGIFGLSAFTAEQRTKEIGIRKVFGASVGNIVVLLSKEFTRLVLFGFILAAPIAYLIMNRWLNDFTYRIDIGWWPFVISGLLAFVVAWITAGFQSVRAAVANPVKSLRWE